MNDWKTLQRKDRFKNLNQKDIECGNYTFNMIKNMFIPKNEKYFCFIILNVLYHENGDVDEMTYSLQQLDEIEIDTKYTIENMANATLPILKRK